jgi:CBS domain-containing protein
MGLQEFMRSNPPVVNEATSISEAARVLLEHNLSVLPVVDNDGRYLGIFSLHRLFALLLPKAVLIEGGLSDLGFLPDPMEILCERMREHGAKSIGQALEADAPIVHPDTPLLEVVLLLYRGENDIPVVDEADGRLLGMINGADLLRRICGD